MRVRGETKLVKGGKRTEQRVSIAEGVEKGEENAV